MYSARSTAASGTSPQDDISLEEFPKSKRTAERYKVDCDDGGDDDYGDDASFVDSYARSDDSRYTLYSEPIGYVAPKSHREMELYIASVHGNREVVARIDHFIGPSSKAKVVSLPEIESSVAAALSNQYAVTSEELHHELLCREPPSRV